MNRCEIAIKNIKEALATPGLPEDRRAILENILDWWLKRYQLTSKEES